MECTLDSLAEFIENHRWIQKRYRDTNEGYCVMGAIYELCPDAYYPLAEKVHEKVNKTGYSNIVDWNDAPDRTKEEVIALLRS